MSVEFVGGLPESLTQGLLVGQLLVGGLGVATHITNILPKHDGDDDHTNSNVHIGRAYDNDIEMRVHSSVMCKRIIFE